MGNSKNFKKKIDEKEYSKKEFMREFIPEGFWWMKTGLDSRLGEYPIEIDEPEENNWHLLRNKWVWGKCTNCYDQW